MLLAGTNIRPALRAYSVRPLSSERTSTPQCALANAVSLKMLSSAAATTCSRVGTGVGAGAGVGDADGCAAVHAAANASRSAERDRRMGIVIRLCGCRTASAAGGGEH